MSSGTSRTRAHSRDHLVYGNKLTAGLSLSQRVNEGVSKVLHVPNWVVANNCLENSALGWRHLRSLCGTMLSLFLTRCVSIQLM